MDQVVDGVGRVVESEAHLHQEAEVVRGNVRVGTADDLPLLQPVVTYWTQDTKRLHCQLGVEDVVNDSFELERVVGEGHQLGGVFQGNAGFCSWKKEEGEALPRARSARDTGIHGSV